MGDLTFHNTRPYLLSESRLAVRDARLWKGVGATLIWHAIRAAIVNGKVPGYSVSKSTNNAGVMLMHLVVWQNIEAPAGSNSFCTIQKCATSPKVIYWSANPESSSVDSVNGQSCVLWELIKLSPNRPPRHYSKATLLHNNATLSWVICYVFFFILTKLTGMKLLD